MRVRKGRSHHRQEESGERSQKDFNLETNRTAVDWVSLLLFCDDIAPAPRSFTGTLMHHDKGFT
jgi:hypothetical protein